MEQLLKDTLLKLRAFSVKIVGVLYGYIPLYRVQIVSFILEYVIKIYRSLESRITAKFCFSLIISVGAT